MKIEQLLEELKKDPRNKEYTKNGYSPILQVDASAKILIIGQAPGSHVERSGIPFDDQSGIRLRKWMGIDDKEFYSKDIAILPMDFSILVRQKQVIYHHANLLRKNIMRSF